MDQKQWRKILNEGQKLGEAEAWESELDGKTKQQAIKYIYKKMGRLGSKIYKDDNWLAVKEFWNLLDSMNAAPLMRGAKYHKDKNTGIPTSKTWDFRVSFSDKQGKTKTIDGTVTAHGAGSVKDPLDRYDITVVMW